MHPFNVFVTNGPVQYAFADYMKDRDAYLGLAAFYERKRNFFLCSRNRKRPSPKAPRFSSASDDASWEFRSRRRCVPDYFLSGTPPALKAGLE